MPWQFDCHAVVPANRRLLSQIMRCLLFFQIVNVFRILGNVTLGNANKKAGIAPAF